VLTSTVDVGQGARTVLAQIVASVLRVPIEQVAVSRPDTLRTPPDQGTVSSRSTYSMGEAVRRAARSLVEQLTAIAERQFEIGRPDLVLADGQVRPVDGSSAGIALQELVRLSGVERITGIAAFVNQPMRDELSGEVGVSTHFHQAAASALVEVDSETGAVDVLDVWVSTHAGVVVNPTLAELQSEGNVAFAVGQALMEEIVLDGGQVLNASLADYQIPSIEDFPDSVQASFTEGVEQEIHGIGETALPAVLPAITNAVADALGTRLHRLPLTPEVNLAALRSRAVPADWGDVT
jgi:CO/xanthine dehydrogenase Mo-binding subunit